MRGLVSDTPQALLEEYLPSGSGTHVSPTTPRAGPGTPFSARYGEDHQAAWAKQEQVVSIYYARVNLSLTGLIMNFFCGGGSAIDDDARARSCNGFNSWNTTYHRSAS